MSKHPRHSLFEDAQAIVTGTLLLAFAVQLFREIWRIDSGTASGLLLAPMNALPFSFSMRLALSARRWNTGASRSVRARIRTSRRLSPSTIAP